MLHPRRAVLAALVALIAAGAVAVSQATAATTGHASGSGAVADGWSFTFDATGTDTIGGASGTMTLTLTGAGAQATADVDCLSLRGSEAVVSGKVTSSTLNSSDGDFVAGEQLVFFVQDNGTSGDEWTYWINEGQELPCSTMLFQPVSPVVTGSVTVATSQPANLTLATHDASVSAGNQACATATVSDASSSPLPGATVDFSVTGANSASGSAVTGSDGAAQYCYTGTHAGTDTIAATAEGGSAPSGTATETYTAASPAAVTFSWHAQTVVAGTWVCETVVDTDAFGNPEPGRELDLSLNGNIGNVRTTAADGSAEFCFAGDYYGTLTVTVTDRYAASHPTDTAVVTLTPGPPTYLLVTPQTATSAAGTQTCVTATVADLSGHVRPGYAIDFSVSGANTASGSGVSDANGSVTYCYTGTHAGTDTVTATAEDGSQPSDHATVTYTPGPPAALTLAPASATVAPGGQVCVTASVADAFGNASSGTAVAFSVSGTDSTSGSVDADANGNAAYCYTAAPFGGSDSIVATAAGGTNPSATSTVAIVVPPSTPGCTVSGGGVVDADGDKVPFTITGHAIRYEDHKGNEVIVSTSIASVVCSGSSATIYGTATVNGGGSHAFRVDVTPGSYRIRLDSGFDSGDDQVAGGNIQIRD